MMEADNSNDGTPFRLPAGFGTVTTMPDDDGEGGEALLRLVDEEEGSQPGTESDSDDD
jgi:hypothetical protein